MGKNQSEFLLFDQLPEKHGQNRKPPKMMAGFWITH
jgi:hypothetical protein